MYQTISISKFRDAFIMMGRKGNFSYEGLGALYDHLQEMNDDYELDVIELCCDYTEDTIENALKEHNLESLEELREATCVVWNDNDNVLFQNW